MTPTDLVTQVTALAEERVRIAARLTELDALLQQIAAAVGPATAAVAPPTSTDPVDPPDALGSVQAAVIAALSARRQPMRPKDLQARVNRDRTTLRQAVAALAAAGKVHVTGATANRRIALV